MSGRLPISVARGTQALRSTSLRAPAAPLRLGKPVTSNAARSYATFEGEPLVKKRSLFTRLLLWTTTGTTVFYGVSTVVALNNQQYQDWFSESVPFGEDILDYLDTHDVVSEAKNLDYGGIGSHAISNVGDAYNRVSEAVHRLAGQAEDEAHKGADKVKQAQKEARAKIIEERDAARKQVAKLSTNAEKKAEDAQEEGKGALDSLKESANRLVSQGKAAAHKAEEEAKKAAADIDREAETRKPVLTGQSRSSAPVESPVAAGGERKLKAEDNPYTRLRPDPEAPKLPQLAPALSSLTGSEPMIGQLAGTIDDLAAFLRDAPATAGNKASYVLDEAKDELKRLSARLDEIRKMERTRAEQSLSQQAQKYENELKRKAEEQSKRYSQLDEDGRRKLDQERKQASKDYEGRLRKELETQREIINERLKEEVVHQGVEMQRRWMKEIKRRVEEERGGRLARLEELAGQLGEVKKVTMDNSAALEEGSGAHRTAAAVRALVKAALADAAEDAAAHNGGEGAQENVYVKRPFSSELRLLRSTPLAQQSEIVKSAVKVLESSDDEGVESLGSLTSWYVQRVQPRLQQVALLPEQAGLLSHLTSAILSPLLFTKSGNPPGTDTPAVLARAQYALLQRKDLDAAAREINSLTGWPAVLAQDWLEQSRKRLEVEQSLGLVEAEASYHSLLNA